MGQVARKTPVELTDFLFLFFEPTPASQAAGRAFIERRGPRAVEPEPPSSEQPMLAQSAASAAYFGTPPDEPDRLKLVTIPGLVANGRNDIMAPTINEHPARARGCKSERPEVVRYALFSRRRKLSTSLSIDAVNKSQKVRIGAWSRLADEFALTKLARTRRIVGLAEVPEVVTRLLKGSFQGRTVVDVNAWRSRRSAWAKSLVAAQSRLVR
ncbi:hypothetical protein ACLEPN_25785 [Myxococcus sp. 1LA]